MTTRKIPLNYRNITGYVATAKGGSYTHFESSLERDALLLLEFDPNVLTYTTQPKRFYYHLDNRKRHYTPDIYVKYQDDSECFFEVKYREDLWKNWAILKPKFKAVIHDLKNKPQSKFKIWTEKEIRGTYLDNITFLLPYRSKNYEESQLPKIKDILSNFQKLTVKKLITLYSSDFEEQATILHTIWCSIANELLKTDLNHPLTMESYIWAN